MIGPQAWENLRSTKREHFVIVEGGGKVYTYTFVNAWEMFDSGTEMVEWCEADARDNNGEYADTTEVSA
tara:strand:- start:234 stop:440 length:207 start_codon:yes stop_codon:yes gene_type:complete